ncbi:acyltransferase [Streptomycetaceae bacterium NBC_01309]
MALTVSRRKFKPARPASESDRIWVLDGVRLAAALMVVAYHYLARGGGWAESVQDVFPVAYKPAAYGWLGVELFFMISGFVICMSCWGRSPSEFFTSRVVRLFPAYWFAVIATTAVVTLVPGGIVRRRWSDVLVNLTMLQQPLGVPHVDGVYWTLAAELNFYLLFMLVVWRGVTYRSVLVFSLVWATLSALMLKLNAPALTRLLMPDYSWYFIAGMAFHLMYRFRPTALLWAIVGTCFLISQHFANRKVVEAETAMGFQVPHWPVTAVLAVFFMFFALLVTKRLQWVRWRWLPTAGALTYPLYLLHEYIGWEIIAKLEGDVDPWALVGGTVALMLPVSWLVHRLLEKPVSRRMRVALRNAFAEVRELTPGPAMGKPPGPREPVHPAGSAPEKVR